ncbi:hypothetical protein AVEN_269905-1 [Araneus ventricosus]|uniref:Uncharacterized protein n=1 Tax=Araneus ventricosus TaxID=182803 RepID=A0A4Y2GBX8_ARAVE|nr:hypothetical protein AVEN_269905-1 [Araneus ventricosus]
MERKEEDLAHLHTSPDSSTSEVGGLRQAKRTPPLQNRDRAFNMQFPPELWVGSSKVSEMSQEMREKQSGHNGASDNEIQMLHLSRGTGVVSS